MLGQLIPCGGGDSIPLLAPKLLIGRRSSCDIKLDFPNVSSHHCELEFRAGYWHIRDLNSSNGIKVNGERTPEATLNPGDEISIAKHSFKVEYDIDASAAEQEPRAENRFGRSLMEKAGLEGYRPPRGGGSSGSGGKPGAKPAPQQQSRKVASEDDFIMDWLAEGGTEGE
ncbi:MAG: FHA domain-containing protein [Planctomycetota bacterium]